MTLSTPVKVVALAGLALILGAGGLLMLTSKGSSTPETIAPPAHAASSVQAKVVKVTPTVHHRPARPKVVLDEGLPAPIASKLRLSRTLVAFVYTGASASDRALLSQARTGAHAAGVPFVALNVTDERMAVAVHGWAQSSADPLVLVVKRPGKIAFQLEGLTDSQTVAQAAAEQR